LGPEGYGQLALFMTIPGIMLMFVFGPLVMSILRFYSLYHARDEMPVFLHAVKRLSLFLFAGFSVFVIGGGLVTHLWISSQWFFFFTVAVLLGMVSGFNGMILSGFQAMRWQGVVAMHSGTEAWLRMALAVALIWYFNNGSLAALVGYFLAAAAVTASLGSLAMRTPALRMSAGHEPPAGEAVKGGMHELVVYASPFAIWAGFGAVSAFADRWMLQGLLGEHSVGIYAAMFQIASAPIGLSNGVLSRLMIPIVYQRAGDLVQFSRVKESVGLVGKLALVYLAFLVPVVFAFYIWAEPLIVLLTAREFAEHHRLLWLIGAGISVFQVGQILTWKGFSLNRPRIYILPKALQAGSFLLLAYLIGGRLGIEGIALALCGSSFVYLAAVMMANGRLVRSFAAADA
jgi:O-antigen/teichoic acid export membrane protein